MDHRGGVGNFSRNVISISKLANKITNECSTGKYIFIQLLKLYINLRIPVLLGRTQRAIKCRIEKFLDEKVAGLDEHVLAAIP